MGEATRENISQRKQQATQKKSHPHTHTQFRTHSKEIKIYDTDSKDVRKNHQPFAVCVCIRRPPNVVCVDVDDGAWDPVQNSNPMLRVTINVRATA